MSPIPTNTGARATYGLDAPGVVRTLAASGCAALLTCAVLLAQSVRHPALEGLGSAMCWMGGSLTVTALLMIASSRWGKLHARDALLDRLDVQPGDTLLDVGYGHGLLLIGGARRLTTGRAVGIDLWSQTDQHANSAAATRANAAAEGVADRVEVRGAGCEVLGTRVTPWIFPPTRELVARLPAAR